MLEFEAYHVHTCYSNALTQPDSTMFIKDYAKAYRERGHKVLCISEHGNRSNVWEQFDICEAYKNDKDNPYVMTPIAAAEAYFVPDRLKEVDGKKDGRNFHLILVAKDMEGFYELNEALSEANLTGFYSKARVDFDILSKLDYKHFICTTACFTKGNLVKTKNGIKPIECITNNDYILNRYGKWEKVNFPTSREYQGLGKKIYIKGSEKFIECTDDHKFLVTTLNSLSYYQKYGKDPLNWVEAKDLNTCAGSEKHILLEPIVEKEYKNKNSIICKPEWKNKLVKRTYYVKNPINEQIKLTPEVMRFFGLWLGDGYISIDEDSRYYCAGITFNEKDFDFFWSDFVKCASEEIGLEWSISKRYENHRVDIASHNIEFVELIYSLFGNNKAENKSIPSRLLDISQELNINIAFGLMLSDGSFRTNIKDGYKCGSFLYVSVSKVLISQFKSLLVNAGIHTGNIICKSGYVDKSGITHKNSYRLTVSNNAFVDFKKEENRNNSDVVNLFERMKDCCSYTTCKINNVLYKKKYINKIETVRLNTKVYCLNVDSHSFVCNNVVVHNCVAGILKDESCEQLACQLHEIFRENFYLEVQHHPQRIQAETNLKALRLYKKYNWPLIYGTDSHYVNKEDKILRTELMKSANITYGDEDSFDLHLPTAAEAFKLFQNQGVLSKAQIEEAMENTLILRDFEGVHFTKEKKIPNSYPGVSIEKRNYLYKKTVCNEYIKKAGMPNKEEAAEIHAEMDTIADTGTADYFLIMKRIIDKGIEYGGVLTTTGRGSGASFATNYAMGFSSINRLHCAVKMYPERFISADRLANGLPDLDCNMANVSAFEKAGKEILGEYGCLPMIAFGTVKTLSAFKLLARARDLDFDTSNAVSKQIQNYEQDVKYAKENNSDDPDYDVDDDVQIENYIDDQYIKLVEDSKQYKGIIVSTSPHPCAHLLLDKDIRREIGVIRVKSKSGNKNAVYAAFIDGKTADNYNYLKARHLAFSMVT